MASRGQDSLIIHIRHPRSSHLYCKLVFCTLVLQVQAPVCASDSNDLVSGVPGWAVVLISLAVALNVGVLVFLVTR